MGTINRIAIVGAGPAGANAAFALRENGFGGQLTLVGAEQHLPYRRPPLSKGFLRGESPAEKLPVKPEAAYVESSIELELGRSVRSLDPGAGRLTFDDGRQLGFDRLVLATGSVPRRPTVAGAALDGVHLLRRVEDSSSIAREVVPGQPAVVLGGGWIGAEVAASLRQMGAEVTLLTSTGLPLERALGRDVATAIAAVHRAQGIRLVTGTVERFSGTGRVDAVVLSDDTRLPATLVVAGLGARPDLALATAAGLDTALGGVAADERLRSGAPTVFVAGDIAAADHPGYGRPVRVEHWDNAVQQGKHVARTLLGADEPYGRRPFFYSDQFDLGLEYRGLAPDPNDVVISGEPATGTFSAFWLDNGRVTAAMAVNDPDTSARLESIVESAPAVDRERLRQGAAALELEATAA